MNFTRRAVAGSLAAGSRPDAAFITVDDLRRNPACNGGRSAWTSGIGSSDSRAVVSERACCQRALCPPLRTSVLTGLRLETARVLDLTTSFPSTMPDAVTLPRLFKSGGDYSHGIQKSFRPAGTSPALDNIDDPASRSDAQQPPSSGVHSPKGEILFQAGIAACRRQRPAGIIRPIRSLAMKAPEVDSPALNDGQVTRRAAAFLQKHAREPFFLGVGFYKPHLPFVAPRKYWDMYKREDLRLPDNRFTPRGAPPYSVVDTSEPRNFTDIPKEGPITEELGKRLLHGYLASVSYVDAQIGLVLDELDRLNLTDSTVVVLLGDNGYQIGEHGTWARKHTNFEISARVPLIIAPPRFGRGFKSATVVELLDVYPTVAALCKLNPPANLKGEDLSRALDRRNPAWPRAAYTQYPRGKRMGRSVTDGRFQYTEWTQPSHPPEAVELYDHAIDSQENISVASEAKYAPTLARMKKLLHREVTP